ncbi:hypothetical protein HELRODRAFT_174171 [Helobdella robusta]|uniref:Uncharacterized protein n=1 Tax=Helobdella robusta TaxID=6412 RepID=T1F7Q6_HELRO|nr:hypothetical protein HELRODRAFT_174171 [Helobdella robusta]ESO02764.1 hypothetical protein HELRODRAFT_174171 [Helobdella robusta]
MLKCSDMVKTNKKCLYFAFSCPFIISSFCLFSDRNLVISEKAKKKTRQSNFGHTSKHLVNSLVKFQKISTYSNFGTVLMLSKSAPAHYHTCQTTDTTDNKMPTLPTHSANISCNWNIINSDNPNNNINNTNNNNSINNNNNNNNSANTVDTNAKTHSANITCKWNIITRSEKNHSDDNNNNVNNNNNNNVVDDSTSLGGLLLLPVSTPLYKLTLAKNFH